ncbi:hypothetical protein V501_07009 [Pseudogymnoascus sp. VKM F-4519 (FW-2642)]|nr:hypothetical protein V501_07009 [Pseudogymnoascus sp. VKM F-4519 (FW-2642)]
MASRRQNVPLSELLNGDDRGAPQQPRQEAPAYFPQQTHQEAVVGSRSPVWAAYRQATRREKARRGCWDRAAHTSRTTSHLPVEGDQPQMHTGTFQIQSHPHRAVPQPKKKKQWEWAPPVLSFEEWVKKQVEPAKKPTHLEQLISFMCSEENLRRIGYRFRALRTIWGSGPLPESSLRGPLIQINKDIYRWRANICQITAILGTSSMSDAAERNETLIGIFSERRRHLDDNVFADRWASYRHNMKMIDGLSFLGATRNSVLGLALLLPEEFDWTRGDKIAPSIGDLESIVKVPELLDLAHELIPYVIWVLNGSSEGAPPPYKGIEVL